MSTMGTFDAFTTARLGIYAAQHGLRVTGNNISNINTEGYTRQRLDQVSFKAGAYDMYRSQLDNHVGSGALVMNINQIRDPYLDVRFRNTNADVGFNDTMLAGLQNIADILDEIGLGEDAADNEEGDGVLYAQLQDLRKKLLAFADKPTKENNDLVRGSAETLCSLFNFYANKLETFYNETIEDFDDKVTAANECLRNIRDLNREIRDCEIYGDNALELRDERNRQIDKLSEYLHIKVVYTEEDVGAGQLVEKLSIYLDNDNPDTSVHTDEAMLIDGIFGAQLYKPDTVPVLNPDYGSKDPAKADLADYLYLMEVQEEDPANPGQMITKTVGTNDPTKATQVRDNDDFSLRVSQLVDEKGKKWSSTTTAYHKVPAADMAGKTNPDGTPANPAYPNDKGWDQAVPAVKAQYSFKYTPADGTTWAAGDQLVIQGTTYTVGDPDGPAAGATAADMVDFIVGKLNADPNAKFTARVDPADADGTTILFEAKQGGKVPAADRPNLNAVDDPNGKLTFGPRTTVQAGKDAVLTPPPPVEQTDPVTGTDSITSFEEVDGVWYQVVTTVRHTYETALDDNDLHGSIQAVRELLTESGEFATTDTIQSIDENAAKKRGIPYYRYSLDLLAKEFAKQYNQLNQGYRLNEKGNYVNSQNQELIIAGDPIGATKALTDAQKHALINAGLVDQDGNPDLSQWLKNSAAQPDGAVPMGGVLFSNRNDRDDPTGITAANISVAHKWSTGDVQLVPKYEVLFGGDLEHSTQNTNADHMVTMVDTALTYNPQDIVPGADSTKLFVGSFNDMFNRINTVLGEDIRYQNIALTNNYTQKVEIDTNRDGVSGVDLNDEAMNMMQFQKAMNAAMRVMTAIDEALDRLINNTGIAGR